MTYSIHQRVWRFFRTAKGSLLIVFAGLLSVMGSLSGPSVLPHVTAAIVGACAVELAATWRRKAWPRGAAEKAQTMSTAAPLGQQSIGVRPPYDPAAGFVGRTPSSALLSGMIVAFVLGPETVWWVTLCVAALATASKYLLRTARGHIFNPAALALLVSIPLFATGQSWWGAGADLAPPFLLLVIAGGAVIVDRINKFPLVLSFVGVYFSVFSLAGLANPTGVAEMFRAPFVQAALFLALFMLTDPPTSPSRYRDQVWIGALAASTACAAQLLGLGQAYLLLGVLVGNAALALQRSLRFARVQSGVNWRAPIENV